MPSAKDVYSQQLTTHIGRATATAPCLGVQGAATVLGRLRKKRQADTRDGSSTIEKRTPALWRCSSETSRQQSSASLRLLNGPLTWAEPSTSLWKFIEPNSPPITQ